MSESWPPQLKDWVAKCLGQVTDSNRAEVQTELKQVISDAYQAKTLWSTDWNGVQLQSLLPKPTPHLQLKRRFEDKPTPSKKKKLLNKDKSSTSSSSQDHLDQAALNRRAERFSREHEIERQKSLKGGQNPSHHVSFINRIQNNSRSGSSTPYPADGPEGGERDWDKFTIVGTSQNIFKDYLRLTTEPDPKDIRPFRILQKTLVELKKRWRENNDYPWICNQFKSIRQDLTVQRIQTDFTVQVYEIHARMALEASDMVEYNQCQGMLKILYERGLSGCNDEFTAYRILMFLHGMNRGDLNLFVGHLTTKQKEQSAIKHALEVQRVLLTNNYHTFFDLYQNAPNMGGYIMDHFVDRERTKALMVMSKAYQQMSVAFIQSELAFESVSHAVEFLTNHNAGVFQNPNVPDQDKILACRSVQGALSEVFVERYRKATIKGRI